MSRLRIFWHNFQRKRPVYTLLSVLVFIVGLELALRIFDPSGVLAYAHDFFIELAGSSLYSYDGLRYPPGVYYLDTYTLVIGLDGLRQVPESNRSDCRIAFIGDSVTFGMGSDISFVNLLAPDIPAETINAGLPGYNIDNIQRQMDMIPADGYIYTAIGNDADKSGWYAGHSREPVMGWAITAYLQFKVDRWLYEPGERDIPHFRRIVADMMQQNNMIVFMFNIPPNHPYAGLNVVLRDMPGVYEIPAYTQYVSQSDSHPSPAGHAEIAAAMHDTVVTFAQQRCQR
jgi:hypothetical protein